MDTSRSSRSGGLSSVLDAHSDDSRSLLSDRYVWEHILFSLMLLYNTVDRRSSKVGAHNLRSLRSFRASLCYFFSSWYQYTYCDRSYYYTEFSLSFARSASRPCFLLLVVIARCESHEWLLSRPEIWTTITSRSVGLNILHLAIIYGDLRPHTVLRTPYWSRMCPLCLLRVHIPLHGATCITYSCIIVVCQLITFVLPLVITITIVPRIDFLSLLNHTNWIWELIPSNIAFPFIR